jgi:hypothetical protein
MLKSTHKLAIATGAALLLVGGPASAVNLTLENYSQGFETLTVADPSNPVENSDLDTDGWEVTGNAFDGTDSVATPWPGNYLYFYGQWYPAPNSGGGGYSAVATGDATNDSGSNYLNVYSNYDDRNAHENLVPQTVNAILARQYDIAASDIGKKLTFTFDAKRPDIESDGFGGDNSVAAGNGCVYTCSAQAFLKTLDPLSNYSTTNILLAETTAISQSEWTSFTLELELTDAALAGQVLQLGFETFATNEDPTGVYYDNINVTLETVTDPEPETGTNVPIPTIALLGFGALLAWSGMSSIRKRLS